MNNHFETTRKWVLVTLAWCVVIEGGAWIADAVWGYRYTLLDRLETAERSSTPVSESDPNWEEGTLRARVPDRGDPRDEPYSIGGRVIADAWPDAKQDPIRVSDLAGDERPRVFILGGSAALGYPYAYADSAAVELARLRPDLRVINVGQVGWASGQIVGVARRIVRDFDPAALVVYSGNNEWIQWAPTAGDDWRWQRTLSHSRALAAAFYLGHRSSDSVASAMKFASLFLGFQAVFNDSFKGVSLKNRPSAARLFRMLPCYISDFPDLKNHAPRFHKYKSRAHLSAFVISPGIPSRYRF